MADCVKSPGIVILHDSFNWPAGQDLLLTFRQSFQQFIEFFVSRPSLSPPHIGRGKITLVEIYDQS